MPLKVRFDSIGNGYGLDVKTTSSPIDAKNMMQTIEKYDYALSAALYMDVAIAAGQEVKDFYFLFANKKSAELVLIKAGPDIIDRGRQQYLTALDKYNRLNESGFFSSVLPILEIIESSRPEPVEVKSMDDRVNNLIDSLDEIKEDINEPTNTSDSDQHSNSSEA